MRPSIRHITEKLKSYIANDAYFYCVLIVLVSIASFGLGRSSAGEEGNQPIESKEITTKASTLVPNNDIVSKELSSTITVVASKSGSKYHLPTCPGAKQIKDTNLVSFESIQAAEAAGYTPAANCKF